MKNNIFISATDQNCEYFAVPMFESFRRYNPDVPMYCVIKNVSQDIQEKLKDIGVALLEYKEPDTFNIRNFSVIIASYVEHIDYDKMMWMDIDALILDDIRDLFDYAEELVVLPRHLGNGWRYVQDNNDLPSTTLGTWVAAKRTARLMTYLYKNSNPKHIEDEGEFMRSMADKFCVRVLDGEKYSCCREMTESLQYDERGLYFMKWGKRQYPKFIHFSLKGNGLRPKNYDKVREVACV